MPTPARLTFHEFGRAMDEHYRRAQEDELEFWKERYRSLTLQIATLTDALRRGEPGEIYDKHGHMVVAVQSTEFLK